MTMSLIDDSDPLVQYSTGSIPWNRKVPGIKNNSADATKCYDQTYTVNQNLCSQSDSCYFEIPFTGSGITILVIQSYNPVNTTMTLDGNVSTTASIVGLPGPADLAYNVTLYNIQNLAPAHHTLNVALVDYIYRNGTTMGSLLRFDYAAVNDTVPPSSVSAPSSGNGSTDTSHSHSIIGPAVGSTVGGIAVIAAIFFALLFCRSKKPSQHITEIDLDDNPIRHEETFTAFNPPAVHYDSHYPSSSQFVQPFTYNNLSTTSFPAAHTHDQSVSSLHPSFSSTLTHATTSALIPRSSILQKSSASFTEANSSMSPTSETNAPNSSQVYATRAFTCAESQFSGSFFAPSGKELTEEQAIFINHLRSSNVPAAEIAHLMDVMRREREGLGTGISRISPGFDADVPPRYDFKSAV